MTTLRKIAAVIAWIGAVFYGVPFLVWLVSLDLPDPLSLALATVGCLLFASVLWPAPTEKGEGE